jgi:uncharacterized protein (TIGR02271 family)
MTQAPDQLYGYEVLDSAGNKLGSVDGVWVDDASDALEFIGVKTGWLMGKTHLIPAENAQIGDGQIQVPYPESQVKDAPSFGTDDELSPADEDQIYSYYGLDRSTAPSPTGLGTGTGTAADTTDTGYTDTGYTDTGYTDTTTTGTGYTDTGTTVTGQDQVNVPLSEEQLQVGKRQVEAGRARIRKVVHTEQVEQPIELQHEEIEIERVAPDAATVPEGAFQEQEIEVPVMREEPVVAKEAQVTGQVTVNKNVQTETQTVGDQVRKEDVEIDRDADYVASDTGQTGYTRGVGETDTNV